MLSDKRSLNQGEVPPSPCNLSGNWSVELRLLHPPNLVTGPPALLPSIPATGRTFSSSNPSGHWGMQTWDIQTCRELSCVWACRQIVGECRPHPRVLCTDVAFIGQPSDGWEISNDITVLSICFGSFCGAATGVRFASCVKKLDVVQSSG